MCGICGFNWENKVLVRKMTKAIRHRGPDDEAYYSSRGVSLGMSRLAIIDLKKGLYPLANEDGDAFLVFNGEIYNYKELRSQLARKGYHFSTNTDAEVVVHPECRPDVIELADAVCSTSQMIDYCKKSSAKEFIIATECGMVDRLKREIPGKSFYSTGGVCFQMKKITLQKVYDCLLYERNRIEISKEIMDKARKALDRMLKVC